MKTYRDRIDLLDNLSELGIEFACEVGVQEGVYSKDILSRIPSLKKLYLVDLWKSQDNYVDIANVADDTQNKYLNSTKQNVSDWSEKVKILKGLSTDMCHKIQDANLDWVYIDARHDYCGCMQDIESYWPKLKPGGVMSGHDYHTAADIRSFGIRKQNWSICYDGTVNPGAVKGAVDDFASSNNLQVLVSYSEPKWHTWSIVKS